MGERVARGDLGPQMWSVRRTRLAGGFKLGSVIWYGLFDFSRPVLLD